MQLNAIVSYLVYPGKTVTILDDSTGVSLPLTGSLFTMLDEVFHKSDKECEIPIRFTMAQDGSQQNPVRDLVLAFLKSPTVPDGRALANRLRDFSTGKSGLGLLFLMAGANKKNYKLVISRFPAEKGILAEEEKKSLKVEFIERIFMKNAASYKAVLYTGSSLQAGFWSGLVVDRQLNQSNDQVADYWIRDFLASDFKTTSKAGTRRLAIALREATRTAALPEKQEIVAAITLGKNLSGQALTTAQFLERLGLSPAAQAAVINHLPNIEVLGETFLLDQEELLANAPLASVQLDTGGILVAPADRFEEAFQREVLDAQRNRVKFTAVGQVVDERLRGKRP